MRLRATAVILLTLGTLGVPLAAAAQQAGKAPRIGYLSPYSASAVSSRHEAFRQGLRELGYVEGKNIVIEYRFADEKFDRLPDLAAELVQLKVDVIVAAVTQASLAAKNATRTIPVVVGRGVIQIPAEEGNGCQHETRCGQRCCISG